MEFWQKLFEQVLLIVLPVLAAALTGWIIQVIREGLARLSDRSRAIVLEGIRLAVYAAEQAGAAGYINDKKQYALDVAQNWLAAQGIRVNLSLLDAMIEAAVLREFNRRKE